MDDGALIEAARRDPRRQVAGRYLLLRELGRGGMGVVWRAWDGQASRHVALKVVLASEPAALLRFEREAQAMARLQHPGIIAIHDVGRWQGRPFVSMELVAGDTLDRLRGPRPVAEALDIAAQLCAALEHAHARGVVHRDLKPANVILAQGRAKVLDFGLARIDDRSRLTQSGAILGTPSYMPPEQLDGRSDARSDLYSLGATLFALLTGQPPLASKGETASLLVSIMKKRPPAPSSLNPDVPPALDALVLRCLEKEPDARFQSATELLAQLQALMRPASGTGAPGAARLASRSSRGRKVGAAAAALLATAAAGVGLGAYVSRRPSTPAAGPGLAATSTATSTSTAKAATHDEVDAALLAGDAARALALLPAVPVPEGAGAARARQRLAVLEGEARWLRGELDRAGALLAEAGAVPERATLAALLRAVDPGAPHAATARALAALGARPSLALARAIVDGRPEEPPAGGAPATPAAPAAADPTDLALALLARGDATGAAPLVLGCDAARLAPALEQVVTWLDGALRAARRDVRELVRALLGRLDAAARARLLAAARAGASAVIELGGAATGEAAWTAYHRALRPLRAAILVEPGLLLAPPDGLMGLRLRAVPRPLSDADQALRADARALNRGVSERADEPRPASEGGGTYDRDELALEAMAAIRQLAARASTPRAAREVAFFGIEVGLHHGPLKAEAAAWCEETCRGALGPEDHPRLTQLAFARFLVGRPGEAFAALERVLDADPYDGDALHVRAWNHARPVTTNPRDLAAADADLRRAILDPAPGIELVSRGGRRRPWLMIAELAQERGDLEAARAACERFGEEAGGPDDKHAELARKLAR